MARIQRRFDSVEISTGLDVITSPEIEDRELSGKFTFSIHTCRPQGRYNSHEEAYQAGLQWIKENVK